MDVIYILTLSSFALLLLLILPPSQSLFRRPGYGLLPLETPSLFFTSLPSKMSHKWLLTWWRHGGCQVKFSSWLTGHYSPNCHSTFNLPSLCLKLSITPCSYAARKHIKSLIWIKMCSFQCRKSSYLDIGDDKQIILVAEDVNLYSLQYNMSWHWFYAMGI